MADDKNIREYNELMIELALLQAKLEQIKQSNLSKEAMEKETKAIQTRINAITRAIREYERLIDIGGKSVKTIKEQNNAMSKLEEQFEDFVKVMTSSGQDIKSVIKAITEKRKELNKAAKQRGLGDLPSSYGLNNLWKDIISGRTSFNDMRIAIAKSGGKGALLTNFLKGFNIWTTLGLSLGTIVKKYWQDVMAPENIARKAAFQTAGVGLSRREYASIFDERSFLKEWFNRQLLGISASDYAQASAQAVNIMRSSHNINEGANVAKQINLAQVGYGLAPATTGQLYRMFNKAGVGADYFAGKMEEIANNIAGTGLTMQEVIDGLSKGGLQMLNFGNTIEGVIANMTKYGKLVEEGRMELDRLSPTGNTRANMGQAAFLMQQYTRGGGYLPKGYTQKGIMANPMVAEAAFRDMTRGKSPQQIMEMFYPTLKNVYGGVLGYNMQGLTEKERYAALSSVMENIVGPSAGLDYRRDDTSINEGRLLEHPVRGGQYTFETLKSTLEMEDLVRRDAAATESDIVKKVLLEATTMADHFEAAMDAFKKSLNVISSLTKASVAPLK